MVSLSGTALDSLRKGFAGELLVDGDPGYDEARALWNGDIDRRPALIARGDERRRRRRRDRVRHASTALEIAVRGGGHSFAGHGVVDDGLMIDLSAMRDGRPSIPARAARGAAAARPGPTSTRATQEHGLAVPGRRDQPHRRRRAEPRRRHRLAVAASTA